MKIKKAKVVTKKTKKPVTKKKKQLSNITTDDFFNQNFEDEINASDNNDQDKDIHEDDARSSDSDIDPIEHKKSLMKLKDIDPEFYTYLQENDKNLLDFDISDDDDIDNDNKSSLDKFDARHIPDHHLEVASDESDYEIDQDNEVKDKRKVTLQLLKTWQEEIQKDKSLKTIKCAVEAFHAALQTVAESADSDSLQYKVEGGVDAFKRYLKLSSESQIQIHKVKRFAKVKTILKSYLTNLIKVLLKFWSSGEENVQVVSFLCILRIATSNRESVLETLFKTMYVKYVENSKFVSLTTLPGINFMRHSLAEIYLLDNNLAYNHAFLYIRQLAIHLRNAVTLKRKEHFQAVYNWQYINSLHFWTELINLSRSDSMLHSLLYPLVQITIGTIKLIPTAQYYPLRFHCLQMLTDMSKETGTFIPILPFLIEVLNSYDFNKKHKAVSMKPIPFICILRMSKSQLQENGFKDNVIDTIYKLILENAAKDSHTVYFPDLYVPCIIQLKAFLKKCHIANYCRKMKQLLDKIEENRKYIEIERNKTIFDLKNMSEIKNWENKIKTQGTSLSKFYESWIKIYQSQKLKLLTKNEDIAKYNLPTIRKLKKGKSGIEGIDDSSEESDFDMRIKSNEEKPEKRSKPKKKKLKVNEDNNKIDLPKENTDIVQDINSDDWD
ncbi:Nucleolar complex protein 2 like protein [Eufriesea mexicana]|nr:Nucleolar complex protein 2 like protein [Eufriesea mexicana]